MDTNNDRRTDDPSTTDAAQRAADSFVASHDAVANEAGTPPPPEIRPTRQAAWLAMGAVALALGLLWLAPGVGNPQQDGTAADEGNPDAQLNELVKGTDAPLQFTLKDMNGVDVKLASFKGKIIVINFWATWCGPCREEIPDLVDVQQRYAKDVVVLGVSVDDPIEKLKPYASTMKMNYPVLVGKDHEDMQDAYGPLFGIPVSVIIDRDGKIWKRHSGIATKAEFEQEIKALL